MVWDKIKQHSFLKSKREKISLAKYHNCVTHFRRCRKDIPIKGYLLQYVVFKLQYKNKQPKKEVRASMLY